MADYSGSAHWRDTARPARFFLVDARAAFPLVIWLLHLRWWTFWLAISGMFIFTLIERWGFSVPVFLRVARNAFAGKHKSSRPWWRL